MVAQAVGLHRPARGRARRSRRRSPPRSARSPAEEDAPTHHRRNRRSSSESVKRKVLSIKKALQRAGAGLAAHLIEGLTQPDQIDQIELVGLVDRGFELRRCQNSTQVDKGADRARHRNAETNPAIDGREPAAPVNSDAAGPPPDLRRHRHLDRPGARPSDPPKRCRALVAEERIGTTCQDSGIPTGELVQSRLADSPRKHLDEVDEVGRARFDGRSRHRRSRGHGAGARVIAPCCRWTSSADSAGVSVSSPPYSADK